MAPPEGQAPTRSDDRERAPLLASELEAGEQQPVQDSVPSEAQTRFDRLLSEVNAVGSAWIQPLLAWISPVLNVDASVSPMKASALVGGLLALMAVVLLPLIVYVYVPIRLQAGGREPTWMRLQSLAIHGFDAEQIWFSANVTRGVNEAPPTPLTMSPTRFMVVHLVGGGDLTNSTDAAGQLPNRRHWYWPHSIPATWEEDDQDYGLTPERVVGFDFQGLNVDPGATYTTITLTNTSLNDFNTTFLAPFITSTLEYIVAHANYENNASSTPTDAPTPPAPVLLRQQALPTQWFPRLPFKKYNTPTWSYIPINLALLPASNKTATDDVLRTLNLTLDSQSIAQQPRPVPGSPLPVLVYIMNFTLSFTNPLSITLANPGLTLHFLVSHRGTQMLRVWTRIPPLTLGRNTRALQLDVESIPAGTAALMEWFGLYAEGVDTRLRAHRCGFDYAVRLDDGRLGWIEKMVRSWDLEVFVRGASEENEFVGLPRDSNLNGERNGWEALSEMGKAMGNVIVRQFW